MKTKDTAFLTLLSQTRLLNSVSSKRMPTEQHLQEEKAPRTLLLKIRQHLHAKIASLR